MSIAETEPAPFSRGDRVVYRPRPAGAETVEQVEFTHHGWTGWLVQSSWPIGLAGMTRARHWGQAEDFAPIAETPAAPPRHRRRHIGCGAAEVLIFALWLAVLYGALVETP